MRVFGDAGDDGRQALEQLGEAAAALAAWHARHGARPALAAWHAASRVDLVDGCVRAVQAAANVLAAAGATQGEVDAAIRRMDERNGDLGRL